MNGEGRAPTHPKEVANGYDEALLSPGLFPYTIIPSKHHFMFKADCSNVQGKRISLLLSFTNIVHGRAEARPSRDHGLFNPPPTTSPQNQEFDILYSK